MNGQKSEDKRQNPMPIGLLWNGEHNVVGILERRHNVLKNLKLSVFEKLYYYRMAPHNQLYLTMTQARVATTTETSMLKAVLSATGSFVSFSFFSFRFAHYHRSSTMTTARVTRHIKISR